MSRSTTWPSMIFSAAAKSVFSWGRAGALICKSSAYGCNCDDEDGPKSLDSTSRSSLGFRRSPRYWDPELGGASFDGSADSDFAVGRFRGEAPSKRVVSSLSRRAARSERR